ncbi:MAG: V-type ATPase subunit [Actinobacteria bacterium]|nr:V-type ATPase subunit [Actinomycetota bacterium]
MSLEYEISDDSYYLFTSAELKAREIELVTKSRMERMLECETLEEFFRVLGETVYGRYQSELGKSLSFEPVMVEEYSRILDFLQQRLKPQDLPVKFLLMLEENLHNIKVVIKSLFLERDLSGLYFPLEYSYDRLREAVKAANFKEIDDTMEKLLTRGMDIFSREDSPRLKELELERYFMEKTLGLCAVLGRRMMADYIRHYIDILNINNIYRHKFLQSDIRFDMFLHHGGFLPLKFLKGFERESMDFFVKELERTIYADIAIRGTQHLGTDCSFSSFERNQDLFFIQYFDNIKYTVSNLEKIFVFFLLKKIELKNLNILFTGILYGTSKNSIKCKFD